MVKIYGKLPRAGGKKRSAPATESATVESSVDPKKSRYRTQDTQEDRHSGLYKRTLRGVQRSSLATAPPVPSAGASGDASGKRHNWSAIAAYPVRPQTRFPTAQTMVASVGTRASTRCKGAQSPGRWTHLGRPYVPPRGGSEESISGLIVDTAGGGKRKPEENLGHPGAGFRAHVSLQSRRETAASLRALTPPPAITQGEPVGDEGAIPPRKKDPLEEQAFVEVRYGDVP